MEAFNDLDIVRKAHIKHCKLGKFDYGAFKFGIRGVIVLVDCHWVYDGAKRLRPKPDRALK